MINILLLYWATTEMATSDELCSDTASGIDKHLFIYHDRLTQKKKK